MNNWNACCVKQDHEQRVVLAWERELGFIPIPPPPAFKRDGRATRLDELLGKGVGFRLLHGYGLLTQRVGWEEQ